MVTTSLTYERVQPHIKTDEAYIHDPLLKPELQYSGEVKGEAEKCVMEAAAKDIHNGVNNCGENAPKVVSYDSTDQLQYNSPPDIQYW